MSEFREGVTKASSVLVQVGGVFVEGTLLGGDPEVAPNFVIRDLITYSDSNHIMRLQDLGFGIRITFSTTFSPPDHVSLGVSEHGP